MPNTLLSAVLSKLAPATLYIVLNASYLTKCLTVKVGPTTLYTVLKASYLTECLTDTLYTVLNASYLVECLIEMGDAGCCPTQMALATCSAQPSSRLPPAGSA